jgi:hypothetical protein
MEIIFRVMLTLLILLAVLYLFARLVHLFPASQEENDRLAETEMILDIEETPCFYRGHVYYLREDQGMWYGYYWKHGAGNPRLAGRTESAKTPGQARLMTENEIDKLLGEK